jgi:hypothetical protein
MLGAPFERIPIDVAEPFPRSDQGNRYLLIAMDYFTKWPEAYAIPNQEASTVAEALVTNFFCRFGIPRELHSDHGRNFRISSATGGFATPVSEQDHHHTLAPAVGRHGRALHHNGRGAPTKGRSIPPEGLERKITHIPTSLQGIHSRHYGLDPG